MRCKDASLPQLRADLAIAIYVDEKPVLSFVRQAFEMAFRIHSVPCATQRGSIDIGAENLERPIVLRVRHRFGEQHCNRIGFLAGRTARHPYAKPALIAI